MALTSTLLRLTLELSDVDRGAYETLELRIAQHPSEEPERVVLRLLARALLHEEGLAFGRGLSTTDEPALWLHDPTGEVTLWVEVGKPSAERLHRASKHAPRVAVLTDRDRALLRDTWGGVAIHRAEALELLLVAPDFVQQVAGRLVRSNTWTLTVVEGVLTLIDGDEVLTGALERTTLARLLA
ncbi:MAG: YaeQ family protein [Deltaproteobacteria bacterium]|nr:YaeQ family protein [Deltaproteobacteria bacterium]